MHGLSPRQQAKIDATMKNHVARAADSETFRAMTQDVAMFGDEAFANPPTDTPPGQEQMNKDTPKPPALMGSARAMKTEEV